jgi:hypothetical protein
LATGATIYRSRSGLRLCRCRHPAEETFSVGGISKRHPRGA